MITADQLQTRLYFVRHCQSEANVLRIFSNRDQPHGLTSVGRAQMEAVALSLRDVPFAAFYTSPVLRARQSAEILSARLDLPYSVTPALREFDMGILEGRSDAESWRRYDELLEAWLTHGRSHVRIEDGETLDEVRSRFTALIEQLRSTPPGGPVLLLGHGGTLICVLPSLMSNVSFDFARKHSIGHAERIVARLDPSSVTCLSWGETWLAHDNAPPIW
jgi:broad specificity phosphatase PhoE